MPEFWGLSLEDLIEDAFEILEDEPRNDIRIVCNRMLELASLGKYC
jgi:hypothetical protein